MSEGHSPRERGVPFYSTLPPPLKKEGTLHLLSALRYSRTIFLPL